MCHSTVSCINFFFSSVPEHRFSTSPPFFFSFFLLSFCSEKKTKAVAVGSVTHSGHVTPASGDESTENGDLGPEGEELGTAEDADAAPDVHVTDIQAPRFADLDSAADRYVFPLPPMTGLSLTSLSSLTDFT